VGIGGWRRARAKQDKISNSRKFGTDGTGRMEDEDWKLFMGRFLRLVLRRSGNLMGHGDGDEDC